MKKLMLFWIECLLKTVFILGVLLFTIVVPFILIDLVSWSTYITLPMIYVSLWLGYTFYRLTDVAREEYSRGIGLFCSLHKYKDD